MSTSSKLKTGGESTAVEGGGEMKGRDGDHGRKDTEARMRSRRKTCKEKEDQRRQRWHEEVDKWKMILNEMETTKKVKEAIQKKKDAKQQLRKTNSNTSTMTQIQTVALAH